MKISRADHAILYIKGQIYVFGGMTGNDSHIKTLNTCEVYTIKDDTWQDVPALSHARQSFSVCQFNEKYIFAFGGKVLAEGTSIK